MIWRPCEWYGGYVDYIEVSYCRCLGERLGVQVNRGRVV